MSFVPRVSRLEHPGVSRLVLAALLAVALAPTPGSAQTAQTLPLELRTKGAATAPVTVYEMADFQCPFCGTFARETFGPLETEFIKTGKVRWVFINLPIPSIHANAIAAAEFGACAALQGKFWPTHDILYATQVQWEKLKNPVPFFQSKMSGLGLKTDEMNTCLQSGRASAMIKDDISGAQRSGVQSTPSFYIEGGIMEGAQPVAVFRHILDSVYKAKTKK